MNTYKWLLGRINVYMDEAGDDGDKAGGSAGDDKKVDFGDDFDPNTDKKDDADDKDGDAKDDENDNDSGKKDDIDDKDDKDADDKDDAGDKKDGKSEGHMIPKARYDTQRDKALRERERREALEKELEALKNTDKKDDAGKGDQPSEVEQLQAQLDELDSQFDEALAEGNKDDLARIRKEVRKIESQMTDARINEGLTRATSAALNATDFKTLLSTYESAHPEINPESPEYNEDLDNEVTELFEGYQAIGYTSQEALSKAIDTLIIGRSADTSDKDDGDSKGEVDDKDKRKTNVDKNLSDKDKQPGRMQGGDDNGKHGMKNGINVMDLSEDEFAKLTEEQLAELRGDHG